MATVAAWAERTHYQRHLIPIWQAIPEANRAGVDLADYVMVAGPKDAATFSRRKLIYVEHGAGQSYRNPDGDGWVPLYSGGDGFGNVALFICPNSEVAARWEARYPAARTAVVGCPALDRFHQAPKLEDPRTVAFTFHWDAMGVAPEARSAFEHYRADLPLIIKLIQREGWKVIGHEHPRWDGQLAMHFEQLGVEFWEYRTVMDHASVLVGDNCVAPDTPVLCADLQWRPAGDLVPGDKVIACDEERTRPVVVGGRSGNPREGTREDRRLRTATVTANYRKMLHCLEVETTRGTLVVSREHPWLVRKLVPHHYEVAGRLPDKPYPRTSYHKSWGWEQSRDLSVGDLVAHLVDPWVPDRSYEAGWLAGIFDGEGCVHFRQGRNSTRGLAVSVAQNPGVTLDRIKRTLDSMDVEYRTQTPSGTKCRKVNLSGGNFKMMSLLASIGATRLVNKIVENEAWDGWVVNAHASEAEVLAVRDVGIREVAVMATSERTFIAGGFVAHNTSMLYEFASLGRPTVVLNAPWYRAHVDHGLRFWSAVPGPMVDRPRDVPGAVCGPLDPAEGSAAATYAYTWLDGHAAERAAQAIMAMP